MPAAAAADPVDSAAGERAGAEVRCDARRKFRLRLKGAFSGRTFGKSLKGTRYCTSASPTIKPVLF